MDKSVPAGAAMLLDFIYRTETGMGPPDCYKVIYGHNQGKLAKPITSMTLDEVQAAQPGWSKQFGSSAAGAAQFMKNTLDAPNTLRDIEGEMGLTGKEKFSPDLQDRMAFHLLKRRGYLDFMAGRIGVVEFGKRLAMEWASFPVLAKTKGQKRQVERGQSYYAGDGRNKALTSPEVVEAVLARVFALSEVPAEPEIVAPAPIPTVPMPVAPRPNWVPGVLIVLMAIAVFAWQWISGQAVDAVATVFPNGAPIPQDRPAQFFGGGSSSIVTEIGWQIALAFVGPLVSAAATAAVGWVVYLWGRLLKTDFDKKSADALHAALERGMLAAVDALGRRANRSSLLSFAADYAQQWNGGTVKRFGLGHEDLMQLALPHLTTAKQTSGRVS